MVNPQVNVGDRLVVLYMYDEIGVPIGTRGTAIKVSRDPFEPDGYIIQMKWDNGSALSLLSSKDIYKKVLLAAMYT